MQFADYFSNLYIKYSDTYIVFFYINPSCDKEVAATGR